MPVLCGSQQPLLAGAVSVGMALGELLQVILHVADEASAFQSAVSVSEVGWRLPAGVPQPDRPERRVIVLLAPLSTHKHTYNYLTYSQLLKQIVLLSNNENRNTQTEASRVFNNRRSIKQTHFR